MILKQIPRRTLLLGLAGILAPLAAGFAAHAARAHATDLARAVDETLARTQTQAAELLERSARRADRAAIVRAREHLERQRADAQEPALVIAEITAACRAAGANIEGVRPLTARGGIVSELRAQSSVLSPQSSSSRYQIIIRGDYATQARLMDACSRRRLPVRVTGFTLAPFENEPLTGQLRGEITVEAYQPSAVKERTP